MSTNENATTNTPAAAADDDFYAGEADGGMFGGVPAKKAQHFWPSAKRLMGLLKPERTGIIVVLAMVTVAVVLNVIAPRILGKAMDVIFGGVVGKQLPAGASKEQFVEGLRAQGQDNFADMLSKMDLVPGVGIPHQRGAGDVLRGQHLPVAAGLRPERPRHAGGPQAAR
jgi:ATP-binding cassette subfamily B multidrug efflux pump